MPDTIKRLVEAPMGLIDTFMDVIQLAVVIVVFVLVFPIIMNLVSLIRGTAGSLQSLESGLTTTQKTS